MNQFPSIDGCLTGKKKKVIQMRVCVSSPMNEMVLKPTYKKEKVILAEVCVSSQMIETGTK